MGVLRDVDKGSVASALEELDHPADGWYVGVNGIVAGPLRLGELRSKAAVGAITRESMVWRDGLPEWQPLHGFPELVAVVEEAASSAHASLMPPPPIAPAAAALVTAAPRAAIRALGEVADPFAPRTPAAALPAALEEPEELAGLTRRGPSPAAWLAVTVALLLGLTIGFVFFGGSAKPQTIVKYVEVPGSAAQAAEVPVASGAQPAAAASTALGPSAPARLALNPRPTPGAGPGAVQPQESRGIRGLTDLGGHAPSGPNGGSGDLDLGSSGQPLDPTQVQRTVSRYTGSVKRSCWQPALDSRAGDAPSTARVTVAIRVAPSGSVESVSTSGDPKGYRGLASCIAGRVRAWQFPASSGATTVNVPFVFAAQ